MGIKEQEPVHIQHVADPAGVAYSVQAVPVFGGHGPVLIGIEEYPPAAQKVLGFVNRLLGGMQQANCWTSLRSRANSARSETSNSGSFGLS
jgi:hypothetical protein